MKKIAAFSILLLASMSLYGTGTPRDLSGINLRVLVTALRSVSALVVGPVAAADLPSHMETMRSVEEAYNPIHGQ